ncbi:MAG: endonuclease/exonuclease/phosphatase family protein, partial [Myxococcota bacterium]|nr:endonuclease/exonuclease/phosphatase family protein [Myxococcota bacterium]
MLFRVGNFNLRNLTLPNFEFYENLSYSPQEYEEKIQWTANQLRKMNAHIVSFQEVFHYQALCEACERSGIYPNIVPICPKTEESEPRVGFISTFPIEEWSIIQEFPTECQTPDFHSFRRPLLKATLRLPNGAKIIFFAVHLKSRRAMFQEKEDPFNPIHIAQGTARSLLYRAKEAIALRKLFIDSITSNTIMAGDLNDSSRSVSSQIIR